jgi:hypothetical protein
MGDNPAGWSASLVHSSPSSARGLPPLLTFADKMKAFRMFKLSISILGQFYSKTVALALVLFTATLVYSQQLKAENEPSAVSDAKSQSVADYSDPIKTYQSFLEAIKRDDLAAAKACCTISDDNKSGSLDVLVGMWVTFHRFNKVALLNFKEETSPYLRDGADIEETPYLRGDCTDMALDRTISRLASSKIEIEGDRAKVTIKWEEDDGYPNQAFFYSDEDLIFRKTKGLWKLDILPEGDPEKLIDLFKPGSWGCAFRDGMHLLNTVIEEIESGKLKTWQQVTAEIEKRNKVLEQKWVEDHHDPTVREKAHTQSKDEQPTKGNSSTTTPK